MLGTLALALASAPVHAAEPSPIELHFVWSLNRARHDPSSWAEEHGLVERIGGDGTPTTLDDVPPRAPLALNAALVTSATDHAVELATYGVFAHQSAVDGRWPNEMVRDAGYPLPLEIPTEDGYYWEIPDEANHVESITGGYADAVTAINELVVDEGIEGAGHRIHLLGSNPFYATHREIGAGFAHSDTAEYRDYWAIHTGISDIADRFLTGVVYDDLDANGLFDPGEGIAGVDVEVDGDHYTTDAAGGWSARVVEGIHHVVCSGPGFSSRASGDVAVGADNREVDCVSGLPDLYVDFDPVPLGIAGGGAVVVESGIGEAAVCGSVPGSRASWLAIVFTGIMALRRRRKA